MADTERTVDALEPQPDAVTPEQPTVSLDSLVSVLTPDQLQSLISAVPEDTLRQMARNQETSLGKVTQSEADRRMESWRQTQLRTDAERKAQEQRMQRQRWLETAPDDEVAARIRQEQNLASVEERVRYNQYVTMFAEMRPFIEALPEERRAKIQEFVSSPGAESQWQKLPTLVMKEYNEHQDAARNAKAASEREATEARRTATAVNQAPPADVGKGATVSGGNRETGDGARDDVREVARRLHEAGHKVPAAFLKQN